MTTTRDYQVAGPGHFGHIGPLDGLRGIAILLVIVGHTLAGMNVHRCAYRLGTLGVNLFFVLSGFLITGILCAEFQSRGGVDLRRFYCRRALRIFPAAYAMLTVVGIAVLLGWVTDVSWKTFAASGLYLRNIFGRGHTLDHLWSLSIEEQFYLIWPPVLAWCGVRRGLWIASIGALAFLCLRTVAIATDMFPYASGVFYERPWFRFDSLLAGCWLGVAYARDPRLWARLSAALRRVVNPLWIMPAAIGWSWWAEDWLWARPIYLSVQLLLVTLLFVAAVISDGVVRRTLMHPWMRWLGRYSYSLYLWQQIFLVTREPSWGWLRSFPVNVGLLIVFALASYHLIERPFLRLKDAVRAARPIERRSVSLGAPQA
jgi:peptidoglycan/LPS O-acetylase OafA/YrhL